MFDWTKYLVLAEELISRDDEECKRAGISRAYYAAFNVTKSKKRPLANYSGRGSHENMWEDSFPKNGKALTNALMLKEWRKYADYDSSSHFIEVYAAKAVEVAKQIIKAANED